MSRWEHAAAKSQSLDKEKFDELLAENKNLIFYALGGFLQLFMDRIAKLCDKRYQEARDFPPLPRLPKLDGAHINSNRIMPLTLDHQSVLNMQRQIFNIQVTVCQPAAIGSSNGG